MTETSAPTTPDLAQQPNLVAVIRHWLALRPDAEMLRFYPQGEGDSTSHSYKSFDRRCQAIASHLQQYRGERVILLYHSGIEFLESFFACFYAGVIAVPAYPPRRNHNLGRLINLVDDCQPALFLSASNVMDQAQALCAETFSAESQEIPWLNSDNISSEDAQQYRPYSPARSDLAFLQYTSGSTGKPKGVMVSHENLMVNVAMAKQHFALPENLRCVSWLPLFHDMGLIGAVMMPLFWGGGSILMPPAAFLQKPLRWLKLLDKYGRHSPVGSAAPNFAYQLCLDQISAEEVQKLDLSNWVFSLAGAEPNRASTLEAFCQTFGAAGFAAEALAPSYGMAECTLLSTTARWQTQSCVAVAANALQNHRFVPDADSALQLVSAGLNCSPQQLLIVEPSSKIALEENNIGEIWLAGEHIAQGYWQQDELTQAMFGAYTADGQGPFLRTGDLGCLHQQQLFITGRAKDLLIIRGRNHYPQDIELSCAQSSEDLQLDHCAAFTVEADNEEKLVLVQEVKRSARSNFDVDHNAQLIRQHIAREHGIEVAAIAFIRFASLAKTSSGKIQRYLAKQQYQQQQLNLLGLWQGVTQSQALPSIPQKPMAQSSELEIQQWIQQWLATKLNLTLQQVPVDAALDGLGLDSVDVVQLSGELENWFGNSLDTMLVWQQAHIQELAKTLFKLSHTDADSDNNDSDDDEIEGFI